MNNITKQSRVYRATHLLCWYRGFGFAFLSLLSFTSSAQDLYLEAQTIKSGEEVSYDAPNAIYTIPGKQFIVESEGYAKLKAGRRIELNPGFSVEYKGSFSATLEDPAPIPADESGATIFKVFPNPTDGLLNVASPQNVDMIRLTDLSGLAVIEQTAIDLADFSIDVSKVKPGFYILEIISGKLIEKIRVERN